MCDRLGLLGDVWLGLNLFWDLDRFGRDFLFGLGLNFDFNFNLLLFLFTGDFGDSFLFGFSFWFCYRFASRDRLFDGNFRNVWLFDRFRLCQHFESWFFFEFSGNGLDFCNDFDDLRCFGLGLHFGGCFNSSFHLYLSLDLFFPLGFGLFLRTAQQLLHHHLFQIELFLLLLWFGCNDRFFLDGLRWSGCLDWSCGCDWGLRFVFLSIVVDGVFHQSQNFDPVVGLQVVGDLGDDDLIAFLDVVGLGPHLDALPFALFQQFEEILYGKVGTKLGHPHSSLSPFSLRKFTLYS